MSERDRLPELLRSVDCFTALGDAPLTLLAARLQERRVAAGEILCAEGEPGDWMFVLGSGQLDVIRRADEGAEITVAVLEAGDFGGMMSLLEQQPRSATLQARTDAMLWILDQDTFRELVRVSGEFCVELLAFMSRRMRQDATTLATTLRYVDVSGAEQRYRGCTPEERVILDTVNQKVGAGESLDAVMAFLFERLRLVGPCDRLGLAFLEENGSRVTQRWCRATYAPLALEPGHSDDLSVTSLGGVLASGRPRVIADLPAYLQAHPESRTAALGVQEGIRSSMACPLIVEGRPLGFLFYSSRVPAAFDAHQVDLHLAIAARLGQAVEKVHRIEQLTAAHQAYIEMLGFVAHELRSPLATIVMQVDVMLRGYAGEVPAAQQKGLSRITDKTTYLLGLIDEYLNLARVESAALTPSSVRELDVVADLMEPAVDLLESQLTGKGMTLERRFPSSPCRVIGDPLLLKIVLVNLIGNAVKYGEEQGTIRLTVEPAERAVRLAVWNTGPGFPAGEKRNLFRKFSRLQTPDLLSRKGTGIGLYTTWRIVQLHGGHIQGDSEVGQWAEFAFTLPRKPPFATS
jgi:hypothetical protein